MNSNIEYTKDTDWLRFPLCVLVVLIHSDFGLATDSLSLNIPEVVRYLIKDTVASFAVPTFFAISGYLFFYKIKDFGISCYKYKLRRRIRSLLVPYVIWNIFYFVLFALKAKYMSGGMYSADTTDYDIGYLITGLWSTYAYSGDNVPIYFAFWFVRDLMVIVLLSPVVYWGIKKLGIWFLGILLIYAIICMTTSIIPNTIMPLAPLFFSIGSYLSITGREKFSLPASYLFALYCILISVLFAIEYNTLNNKLFHYFIVLIGFPSLIFIGGYLNARIKIPKFFSESSFFVYALHVFFLSITNKLLFTIFHPQNQLSSILIFLSSITFAVILCCLAYNILKRFLPVLAKVLSGGR